jgi:hypothetical protein
MLLLYEEEYEREALEYASQSIDAVRRAWGSDHPEYALILNDAVQLDYKLNGDSVSLQAEAALLEVYRIRAARMGETHKETIATLIYLGRIQGLHSRTGGTLAGAAPAIATLQKAVALTDRWRPPGLNDIVWARQVLAETFARNGALQPAMQTFAKAIEVGVAQDAPDAVSAEDFIDALEEGGFSKEAQMMREPVEAGAADQESVSSHTTEDRSATDPASAPPGP